MVASVQLQAASFRGAAFLVPDDGVDEGPNSIIHKYPDRRTQYVEDNGLNSPSFRIKAVLTGKNALAGFQRLRTALNAAGPGTLKHPWYGNRRCSVVGPYKVTRSDKQAGIIRLEITFQETSEGLFPLALPFSPAALSGLVRKILPELFGSVLSGLQMDSGRVSSRIVSGRLNALSHHFQVSFPAENGVFSPVRVPADFVIDSAPDLAEQLVQLFLWPFASAMEARRVFTGFVGMEALFESWDLEAVQIEGFTRDLLMRRKNLELLSGLCRAATLMSLCEAVAVQVFQTAESLDRDRRLLLSRRERLFADGGIALLDDYFRGVLDDVFNQATGLLNNLELQLPKIGTLEIWDLPASVLAYLLYDDDGRANEIMALNEGLNPVLYDGEVKVLRDG